MDPNFILLALFLLILFASISAIGSLHRIRDASEKTLALLEAREGDRSPRD